METNKGKHDLAPVKLDNGSTENAIEKKNDLETKEQKSETVFSGFHNETETGDMSVASNLVVETSDENKKEKSILEYPESKNSECSKAPEIQKTNENDNISKANDNIITKANCDKLQPSDTAEKKEKRMSFKAGKVVFATLKTKSTKKNCNLIYYAGIIINNKDCCLKKPKKNYKWVYWFLTKNVSMVPTESIIDFASNLMDVKESIEVKVNPKYRQKHIKAVREAMNVFGIHWNKDFSQTSFNKACSQFLNEYKKWKKQDDYAETRIPETVAVNLKRIKHMNKKNTYDFIKSGKRKSAEKPTRNHPGDFIKSKKRKSAEKPTGKHVDTTIQSHRSTLKTIVRKESRYMVGAIRDSLARKVQRKHTLIDYKHWCESKATYNPSNVAEMSTPIVQNDLSSVKLKVKKQPVRVLALFDGLGCGILALKKLGIEVEVYYISETDEDDIYIANNDTGDSRIVHHLGDAATISERMLKNISPINLLIGGCNEFRRGKYYTSGTDVLFFNFYRIRNLLETINKDKCINFYWLYEADAAMENHHRETITRFLGSTEVVIDAVHYSPLKGSRLYWGNIPGLHVLGKYTRVATCTQLSTINPGTTNQGVVVMDSKLSNLWLNELEILLGLREEYTYFRLAQEERQVLISRTWSIPIICKILKPLVEIFLTRQ